MARQPQAAAALKEARRQHKPPTQWGVCDCLPRRTPSAQAPHVVGGYDCLPRRAYAVEADVELAMCGEAFGSRRARNLAKDTKPPTSSTG